MSYTYIPTTVMIIVYVIGFTLTLGYMGFTILKFKRDYKYIKEYTLSSKLQLFVSLVYSIVLLCTFVVHVSLSGLYHDSHATGPSDAEHNFNIINIVLTLLILSISNNVMDNKNLQKD